MDNKKTVVVYVSFYDAYKKIKSLELRDRFFQGMMEYGLNGIEPDFEDNELLDVAWATYKPNVDANVKRYQRAVESGRKSSGNRNPKKKKETPTKVEPKVESKVVEKPIEEPSSTDEVYVSEVEVVEEVPTKAEDNSDNDSYATDEVTSDNTNGDYAEMYTLWNGVEVGVCTEDVEIWNQIKKRIGTMRRIKKNNSQITFDMQLKEEIENIKNKDEIINNYINK